MAIGRTERALYGVALDAAEATVGALNALELLARDFGEGDPDDAHKLALQARELHERIRDDLSCAL